MDFYLGNCHALVITLNFVVAFICSFSIPKQSLIPIKLDSVTNVVHITKLFLGILITMLSSPAIPLRSFLVILVEP